MQHGLLLCGMLRSHIIEAGNRHLQGSAISYAICCRHSWSHARDIYKHPQSSCPDLDMSAGRRIPSSAGEYSSKESVPGCAVKSNSHPSTLADSCRKIPCRGMPCVLHEVRVCKQGILLADMYPEALAFSTYTDAPWEEHIWVRREIKTDTSKSWRNQFCPWISGVSRTKPLRTSKPLPQGGWWAGELPTALAALPQASKCKLQ